jgi:opacity protein-like surface antigen
MKVYKKLLTALALVGMGLPAQAESIHPQLTAKHTFIVGGFRQSVDGELYAQADGRPKRVIDFGDLDVDDTESTFMGEYRYRLNDKWMFTVGAFRFDTDGTIEGAKEFEYDGVIFEAGASLDTKLRIDTYMLEAMYSVYKTDRAQIYLGGGLHMFDFSAEIEARIFVGDQERTRSQASDDILAPLPNLRAQGFFAITPKWAVTGAVGWLSAKYEDYSGSFIYVHARTMYRLTERFGVGVGYQYVDVDLEVDRSRGEAGFDIQFQGPTAYLAYSF